MKSSFPSWWSLFAFAVASRVLTCTLGVVLYQQAPPTPGIIVSSVGPAQQPPVEIAYRWDANAYREISQQGYRYVPGDYSTVAFLPLLPVLMWTVDQLGGNASRAGVLLPNLAFCVGVVFFARAMGAHNSDRKTIWKACALLCAFPTAFFFSCPYQESFGFLFTAAAIVAWQAKPPRVATSSAMIFLACLARQTAQAFAAAIMLDWLISRLRAKPSASFWAVASIAFVTVLAVGLFYAYMAWKFGDAFAPIKVQSAWNRSPPSFSNIARSFVYIFYYYPRAGLWQETIGRGLPTLLFLFLGLRGWYRHGTVHGCLILLPLIQILSTGSPMSMERLVLGAFPAFLDLAEILKRNLYFFITLIVMLILQLLLLNGYVHYQFVG